MTRVGVDVGGTFTDLIAVKSDGSLEIRKVASTPQDPSVGLLRSLDVLGAAVIDILVHGTTVATNALLERAGARVVLVTTAGFEDLLWLRRQDRSALYDLAKAHPEPLVAQRDVIGARERMGPDGVVTALSEREIARVTAAVRALGGAGGGGEARNRLRSRCSSHSVTPTMSAGSPPRCGPSFRTSR